MELYLDTAILDEIRQAHAMGVLAGVTTNPSLIVKSGRDFHQVIQEICALVADRPVSAEVTATDAQGMIAQGRELAALAPNVVVKVPLTPDGLTACHQLAALGIATNVTLVFSANQGLLAARAGARYVSPFVGRLDDVSHDGMQVVRDLAEIFMLHDLPTRIIAASIRHPLHVTEAAKAGAHIATLPFDVLKRLWQHPLTDAGLARFLADWEQARPHAR